MRKTFNKNIFSATLGTILLLGLGACSSSPTSEDQPPGDAPAADAGTDAVPTNSPEGMPPAPADGTTASADPGAPPPPTDAPPSMDAPPPPPAGDQAKMDAPPPPAPDSGAPPPPVSDPMTAPPPADASASAPKDAKISGNDSLAATSSEEKQAKAPSSPSPSTPEPVSTDSGDSENYTVQSGDTLMKIAFETYGDVYKWRQIYQSNQSKIQNPNSVPPGTVLSISKPSQPVQIERNGEKYMIKRGDTLGTISNDVYGSSQKWRKIWENNRQLIKDPNRIFAGFYLYYVITDEDKQELEKFKNQAAPQPVAENSGLGVQPLNPGSIRTPSGQPAQQAQAMQPMQQPGGQAPGGMMPAQPGAPAPLNQ